MKCWQQWQKLWRRPWQNRANLIRKELYFLYGWVPRKVPFSKQCPYVVVFKINLQPNGDAIPNGFAKGKLLRKFVHENVLWKSEPNDRLDTVSQNLVQDWDQIIPSISRLPTHRLEMGIMRKKSGVPRSPFFDEYFCFLPMNGQDSDKAAIRIAGFLSSRLQDANDFQGEALKTSKVYWLVAILVAWKRLS